MEMRKMGAVPVPYIIALVLAIIVIALIAYWLFFSGGEFGRIIAEKGCEAKKLAYCNEWKTTGIDPAESGFSAVCETANADKEKYYAPECCWLGWARILNDVACGIATTTTS